jgi:nucleoside-diphosphate-sugar epimerase
MTAVGSSWMLGYRGTRVAVTGATGFIGRWVARALCEHGADVHLIVRDRSAAESIVTSRGSAASISTANLSDCVAVYRVLREIRPSIIFNLAAYGVDRSERDENAAYQINAHLVRSLCGVVRETRDPGWSGQDIVHVGSALEYGAIGGNLAEESVPNPTTLYGQSKLAGTRSLADGCLAYSLKGLTARLFAVYGSGEQPGRLVPALLKVAKTGETLQLTSGEQMRDFTYVQDVVEGLLRLGLAKAGPGEIVNLATGRLTSVRRFIETTASVLQIPDKLLRFGALPVRDEEMTHSDVSVRRLQHLIAWVPAIGVTEGIRRTWALEQERGI